MNQTVITLTFILALSVLTTAESHLVNFAAANSSTSSLELPYIYITLDGTVQPQTVNIQRVGDMYIFKENIINRTLVVERNNVVIDGAGYSILGNYSGTGVRLVNIDNVTIKNITLKGLDEGVLCRQSSDNTISNSTITECLIAIHFVSASNNTIAGNNIARNYYAITMYGSSGNSIIENQITESNREGIRLDLGDIYSANVTFSNYCNIIKNNITANLETGINLFASSHSRIEENFIAGSTNGVYIYGEKQNIITNNIILNNTQGIALISYSTLNNVTKNQIVNNTYGVFISGSNNNLLFHNNFVNNGMHVSIDLLQYLAPHIPSSANTWDNGKEGNNWSNYTGNDANSDGIGDTPYVIDANNVDNYPLVKPLEPEPEEELLTILSVVAIIAGVAAGVAIVILICWKWRRR